MAVTMTAASGDSIQVAVRTVCLLALLIACLTADTHATSYDIRDGRHNITMGIRSLYPRDQLLFNDASKAPGSWFPYPQVKSDDVCYPPKNYGDPRRFSITLFNVTDMIPHGEGGLAYVTEGGVNSGKLCLHLKSQRGKGYNFNIDIWGYYL